MDLFFFIRVKVKLLTFTMRVLLFVIFIIMIAIFLNELVNITSSYLKINYYRDVSEYNIRNNCNNIFCEAETARFNLAKNSYKLILPNDNFNSKIYYYALLFIFVTVFLMFLYKFWDYNKKSVEYHSDIDGRVFISYLFIFPYLFTFAVVAMLTVMIVRRYAPTDSKGYQKYFVTDNDESININTILDYSKKIITGLVVIWFVFSIFSNIPRYPINNFKYGTNLWYISLVYLVALTIILNFMIILSNIAFTFNDSTAVDLAKKSLIKKLRGEVMKLKVISKDELIKSLAIELDKEVTDKPYKLYSLINGITNDNGESTIIKSEIDHILLPADRPFIKYYFINDEIKEFSAKDVKNSGDPKAIESPYVEFTIDDDLSNIRVIHRYIESIVKTDATSDSYITKIDNLNSANLNLEDYIRRLAETSAESAAKTAENEATAAATTVLNEDTATKDTLKLELEALKSTKVKLAEDLSDAILALDDIASPQNLVNALKSVAEKDSTISLADSSLKIAFEKAVNAYNLSKKKNLLKEFFTNSTIKYLKENETKNGFEAADSDADKKNVYKNALNPETNINYKLIKIICNFTKYIILYFLKKEINKNNDVNYEKCLKMYKLFNYIDELDYKYSKMSYEKIKNIEVIDNFIFEYKLFLVVYDTSIQTDLSDNNIIDDKIKEIIYKYYHDYYESLSKNDQDGFKKITKKCHDLINHNNLNIDLDYNDAKIFNENISDVFNSNDKLNADTSYNSENTYYQKYFNIAGEENLYQKYNIGNYDYKNIEEFLSSLFLYVIFFIVFAFIIMFLQSDIENFSPFEILGREIVTPFVALFIVVLFIYIFVNFNTKYNLYFIYGVLDSFYKRDLLQYNNIITPFIRLHDNNVENSRDYRKHYIITNVIASIISNRLNLHKISYDKDEDIFEVNDGIAGEKIGDGNIVNEISNNFEELSDNTFLTTNAEYFKYISDYNEFKKYNSNIYKNITSNYFGGDFNAASPQKIYNFIHNLELTKSDGDSDVMDLYDKSKVSNYIKSFIEKYINIIVRVIIECEYILENDEFNDDDRFDKFKKYFYFYKEDSDNKSIPYKFIIKLTTLDDFNDFINRTEKSELKVIFEDQKKLNDIQNNYNVAYKIQDYTYGGDKPEENKLTNADIIVNFLKIVSHLKYNYEFLTIISDETEKAGAKIILEGHTDFISTQPEDGRLTFGEYIKRIHNFHNMRLMYLITDHTPSPASLELIENISVIKDTFRNTITEANFASGVFYDYFMNLKFICNLLKEYDSESGIENINSNYLKNVIKTTYKQINEENIRFRDRNKYAKDYMNGNNYNISPIPRENYNTKSDSIKNITNNANYFTGHGILFNYFANAVLILVIYNLGYN